ncbi:MAG: PAS domain-containing protein [Flavobacteriales bacterium]|nr:PAS domain-containing protein [Flavobacteriales bacterium]
MEKSEQIEISYNSLVEQVKTWEYDDNVHEYLERLKPQKMLDNFMEFGSQFMYIINNLDASVYYVSEGVERMLGVKPEDFSLKTLYGQIHPDDRKVAFEISQTCVDIAFKQNIPPLDVVFVVDYRMKRSDGTYVRIHKRTTVLSTDDLGNMVFTLGMITDITKLKLTNDVRFYVTGSKAHTVTLPCLNAIERKYGLSQRERQIIQLLARGLSSNQIAKKLFLSESTVSTHRRNMKRKTGAKTTGELVRLAFLGVSGEGK